MALSSPEAKRATKSEDAASSAAQLQHANSTEESETNPTAMHGFKLFAVFIGICVGAFLMSLDIFVIATAIPSTIGFSLAFGVKWTRISEKTRTEADTVEFEPQ